MTRQSQPESTEMGTPRRRMDLPKTRAEIDLEALAANVQSIRKFIGQGVKLLVVVKADAYGHGAIMVARQVLASGASHLAVYTSAEAVSLRRAGVEAPILVLGPIDPAESAVCVSNRLTPCIASLSLAQALSIEATSAGLTIPYHVEVDTGLTRYGILASEAEPFLCSIQQLPGLAPEGIFTHYASADEPEPSKQSAWRQFEVLESLIQTLEKHGIYFPLHHAAASAAMLGCPEMHLQMVRCGVSVYGYYPSATRASSRASQACADNPFPAR